MKILLFCLLAIAAKAGSGERIVLRNSANTIRCGMFYLNGEPVLGSDLVNDPRQRDSPGEFIVHCVPKVGY